MLHVYICPLSERDNTTFIKGEEVIHDAIIEPTATPHTAKVIMDTTPSEHKTLITTALSHRPPDQNEVDAWRAFNPLIIPDPDTIRAQKLLAISAPVITMPEIWELLRIFGRLHGFTFDQ